MDAITMLKEDHKKVKGLFRDFERASGTERKRKLVEQMIEELSVHAALEEQIFYPAARETLKSDDEIVLEALEEHHVVKWTLKELDEMAPDAERFDAKVKVMMESVKHHISEEEGELFPVMRDKLGRKRLQEIGEAMAKAKPMAPTKPHPRMPDEPPANVIGGMVMGAKDKVVDITEQTIDKAKESAGKMMGR